MSFEPALQPSFVREMKNLSKRIEQVARVRSLTPQSLSWTPVGQPTTLAFIEASSADRTHQTAFEVSALRLLVSFDVSAFSMTVSPSDVAYDVTGYLLSDPTETFSVGSGSLGSLPAGSSFVEEVDLAVDLSVTTPSSIPLLRKAVVLVVEVTATGGTGSPCVRFNIPSVLATDSTLALR